MPEVTAPQLVTILRGKSLRNRTAVLLLPPSWFGREREIATRLGISFKDERDMLLSNLAPGQRYLGQTWRDLIAQQMDDLDRGSRPDGDCVLVANVDILLSSFLAADRRHFWAFLREAYKPSWGLLLVLPNETRRVMTPAERSDWASDGRLGVWAEGDM